MAGERNIAATYRQVNIPIIRDQMIGQTFVKITNLFKRCFALPLPAYLDVEDAHPIRSTKRDHAGDNGTVFQRLRRKLLALEGQHGRGLELSEARDGPLLPTHGPRFELCSRRYWRDWLPSGRGVVLPAQPARGLYMPFRRAILISAVIRHIQVRFGQVPRTKPHVA